MKRQFSLGILTALLVLFVTGCGKKTDEALLTEYNAKKGEAEKVIADATEGLKKLNEEHTSWNAKISEAAATNAIDSAKGVMLHEKLHAHEPMVSVVQAGIDSLKNYVSAKAETDDELKAATAGLNAHLAAVSANWKALWEAHTKAGAEITADLGAAAPAAPTAAAGETSSSSTTTTTTKTTTVDQTKHETAKQTPGAPKNQPPTTTTPAPMDQTKHEPAKQSGGAPKAAPAPAGTTKK